MWCAAITFVLAVVSCYGLDDEFKLSIVNLTETKPDSRIIGGSATNIERFPYGVQVLYNSQLLCGGSLITQRHVLSAGHCFVDEYGTAMNPRFYSIRAGSSLLNSGGTVHSVSTIIVHERYNNPVRDNDIAVVLMSSAVTISISINTAYIPAQGNWVPDNSSVIAIGWGRTSVNIAAPSQVLQEVEVRTINLFTCQQRYAFLGQQTGYQYPVTDSMICAGILDVGGRDACQGDSGGPLIYNGVVVGITSWGYGCADPTFPGVFARVASYSTWINSTVTRYNSGPLSAGVGYLTMIAPLLYLILSA